MKARRGRLAGRVRLLFQPAEEIGAGALAVIEDGALDGVDDAIMAHVFSVLPFGTVALREGVALAGADFFELTARSGGGHAALAHETGDAVFAAAQVVSAMQSISAGETSPRDFLVLGVTSIAGGTAANVVVDEVTLRGSVRWLDTAVHERALARMDEIAAGVCAALRVSHRLGDGHRAGDAVCPGADRDAGLGGGRRRRERDRSCRSATTSRTSPSASPQLSSHWARVARAAVHTTRPTSTSTSERSASLPRFSLAQHSPALVTAKRRSRSANTYVEAERALRLGPGTEPATSNGEIQV